MQLERSNAAEGQIYERARAVGSANHLQHGNNGPRQMLQGPGKLSQNTQMQAGQDIGSTFAADPSNNKWMLSADPSQACMGDDNPQSPGHDSGELLLLLGRASGQPESMLGGFV